ncbi:hypothetical protein [Pseudoxanthomonas dokdonensis]|nr:hypothetical protein [Pseudoxanthomonas dokdonensis]
MLSLLLLAPVAALAQNKDAGSNKKLYCWDENGQRVCSDALPAEAVNRAREEISARSGLKTAEIDRALTDEERAVAAAEAAQRLLDEAKVETRRRTEQAMLTSYRSEEELMRVFSERTTIVDNNVRTAQYNVGSLRDGLVSLLQVAGDRELDGKPVSEDMANNIRRRHLELMRQLQLQANFERQRVELDDEVAETLQRYRAMKGDGEADATATPAS